MAEALLALLLLLLPHGHGDPTAAPKPQGKGKVGWCPSPLEFEQGWFWPRGGGGGGGGSRLPPGTLLEFGCFEGFTLRGPQKRRCLPGGRWEGPTPACDDGAGACPAPGVPPGATKEGSRYGVEDRVRYQCAAGLRLLGSAQRRCQESGQWSGTEPRCRDPEAYDAPEDVAASFLASLTETVEVAEANSTHGPVEKRRLRLGSAADLTIFLVLDASRSVGPEAFADARRALQLLLEKIASYGAAPRYGLITFGTEARVVVSPTEARAADAAWVSDKLQELNFRAHAQKPGTNLQAALRAVYELLVQQEQLQLQQGLKPPPVTNSTRHVLVLMTDGMANMGGRPEVVINQIREMLSIGRDPRDPREDFLDVYVFGVGSPLHDETLNALASKKNDETHLFLLQGLPQLHQAFESMIDESETLGLCGLSREGGSGGRERDPWILTLTVTRPGRGQERCRGALVSPYFVLTAAHCFEPQDKAAWIAVETEGGKRWEVSGVSQHPQFELGGRRDKGVPEFYDYDVALVRLKAPVTLSLQLRPLCLPCTEGASRALRLPPARNSCQEHRRLLLPPQAVEAFFVSLPQEGPKRQLIHLQLGAQRGPCEADALRAVPYGNVSALEDVVTPRFLCSGGTEPRVDPNACRGDSGGPVIVTRGGRYFQVGVISWGVLEACGQPRAPPHARDFHINLFEVLPWLREQLQHEELGFLPSHASRTPAARQARATHTRAGRGEAGGARAGRGGRARGAAGRLRRTMGHGRRR